MRLAISHIAWDASEDEDIAGLLLAHGVDAIDIAPATYFPDPGRAADRDMKRVRGWWSDRGIEITGMQALLFGAPPMNLFGDGAMQSALLEHLASACRIGAGVGATRLVFGSPKSRDRGILSDADALDVAVPFFRRLGDIAAALGVAICLEPNPPRYGANFMTTAAETAKVVTLVGHAAIRMQFDTGALAISGEDPAEVLSEHAALVGHIHASEPDLVPLGDGATQHARMAEALRRHLPSRVVCIEMVATRQEAHRASIERALRTAASYYGDPDPDRAAAA